jgi:hypothetical protein
MVKVKATFELDPKAKRRLAMMKADLRMQGIPATEAAIVEALIVRADIAVLARMLKVRH